MIIETGLLLVGAKTFALIPLIAAGAGALLGGSTIVAAGLAGTGLATAAAVAGGLAGASMGTQYTQGQRAAGAAKDQAQAQNDATNRRYEYDVEMWKMKKQQMQARRTEEVDSILTSARNEGKLRAYKDAAADQVYQYQLQIRNNQQAGNEAAFQRSEDVYYDTLDLNSISARGAMDSEIVKLQEISDEQAFDRNEAYIEAVMAEGKLRARTASGRTGIKGTQATLADYGRQIAMLDASMISEGRNTRAILEEIIQDKTSADLVAYAGKMLSPGQLPMPVKPEPIPVPEYTLPRAWSEFDYGPQPVWGAMSDPNAAYNMAMANTWTGIASGVGTFGSTLAGMMVPTTSDADLKENIQQVGTSPSGLNIYEFNYLGESTKYRGVTAQDLLSKGREDAVTEMDNGYYGVYYDRIDVDMQTV